MHKWMPSALANPSACCRGAPAIEAERRASAFVPGPLRDRRCRPGRCERDVGYTMDGAAVTGGPVHRECEFARYLFGRDAGVPVVAGASSGIQVMASRSYLNPLALFRASFVEFMTKYHLLLSLLVTWTALNATATSFSPIPRKPPTPTISAVTLPSRSTSTSMISPILLSAGS